MINKCNVLSCPNKLDIQMAELRTDINYIKGGVKEAKEANERLVNKIEDYIYSIKRQFESERTISDNMYASKYAEKAVWFVGGIVTTAIISGFIYMIFKLI